MTEEKKKDAINFAKQAFQQNDSLKGIAYYISVEFEKKHGGVWRCIVGIEESYDHYFASYLVFSLGAYTI
jgi:hypothetical protein